MYFLAKNLRTCSKSFRSAPNALHLYKNGVLNWQYLAKNMSFFMMHPEQLKQKLKERDAHKLCEFFDSEDYKKRVTAFLEMQSKILSKDTIVGVKRVKYQHVLSCAQPAHKKTRNADLQASKGIKVNDFKIKKGKKGTIFDHIMKRKSYLEAIKEVEEAIDQTEDGRVKKLPHRTTIMPIFLKKMKKKFVPSVEVMEEDHKPHALHLQTARRVPGDADPEPLYAQILHRSNISQRGLRTLVHKPEPVDQKIEDLEAKSSLQTSFLEEDPHTLIFENSGFKVQNISSKKQNTLSKVQIMSPKSDESFAKADSDTPKVKVDLPSEAKAYQLSNMSSKLDRIPYKLPQVNSKFEDVTLKLGGPPNIGHVPLRMSSSTARVVQKGVTTKLCPKKTINMNRKSFSELLSVEPVDVRIARSKRTNKVDYDPDSKVQIKVLNKSQVKKKAGMEKGEGGGQAKDTSLQILMQNVYKSRALDVEDNLERRHTIVAVMRNRGAKEKKKMNLEMPSLFQKVKMGSSQTRSQFIVNNTRETKPKKLETKTSPKRCVKKTPKNELNHSRNQQQSCTYKIVAKTRERLEEGMKKKFSLNPPFWKNSFRVKFGQPGEKSDEKENVLDVEEGSTKSGDLLNSEEQRQKLGLVSRNIGNNLHRPVPHFVNHADKPKMGRSNQYSGRKLSS